MVGNAVASRLRRGVVWVSLLWVAGVSGVALYERSTVDPWSFLGEDRGAIFLTWAPHLDYSKSPFGDIVIVLDQTRFWLLLLGPVIALGGLALLAGLLLRARAHGCQRQRSTPLQS
jgi:hypothetical protein